MVLYPSASNRKERQRSLYYGGLSVCCFVYISVITLLNPSATECKKNLRLYSLAIEISQCDHLKSMLPFSPSLGPVFCFRLPLPAEMWSEP